MIKNYDTCPVFLTGFSGAGKTTIGQGLAFSMDRRFIDLDKEVELLSGKTIGILLETEGELVLRDLESSILNAISRTQNTVIALGGGTLIRLSNINLVKELGLLVHLDTVTDLLIENLKKSYKRPLLNELSESTIEVLMEQRRSGYAKADLCVKITKEDIQTNTDLVYQQVKNWIKKHSLN